MKLIVLLIAGAQIWAQTPTPPPARPNPRPPAYPQRAPAEPAVLERGKALYGVNCNFCHGSDARGGEGGPNLLRSQMVLDDKNGELIATVVQNGRVDMGMPAFPNLTASQVGDIAAYIHNFPVINRDPARFPPPSI